MGFNWDEYKSGSGYLTPAEKQALVDTGMPFTVTAARGPLEKGFEKPAVELDILVPDPETGEDEERCLSFAYGSGVESRDRMVLGFKAHFAGDEAEGVAPGEPIKAKLTKKGRSFVLEPAEA